MYILGCKFTLFAVNVHKYRASLSKDVNFLASRAAPNSLVLSPQNKKNFFSRAHARVDGDDFYFFFLFYFSFFSLKGGAGGIFLFFISSEEMQLTNTLFCRNGHKCCRNIYKCGRNGFFFAFMLQKWPFLPQKWP